MRIGIVNDMTLAREVLRRIIAESPSHVVAWTADDGSSAIECARRDLPDLILMDLFMPRVDGVEATRKIMAERPCAILIVTATVSGHLSKVYEAMGYGALDAVDTPVLSGSNDNSSVLLQKINTIGLLVGKVPGTLDVSSGIITAAAPGEDRHPLVLLGSSTGGPSALAEILGHFPKDWNATTVIVQHVDATFAPGLATWLGERTGHRLSLVASGVAPEPGRIYLAATNDHVILQRDGRFGETADPIELSYRPSVDVLFRSARRHWPRPGVAALLTGMGRDGASGLLELRRHGWYTIAQEVSTCVVGGMPKAAIELDAAVKILPLPRIGRAIVDFVQSLSQTRA
jgi:two-component system response regulator WspF